jgi:hypothetical protein
MFLALAMIIGTLSVFYTGKLVSELAEREQKMIDLYAKGFEYIAGADDVGNLAFLFQEIIEANNSIPVILTNPEGDPVSHKNVSLPEGISKEEEMVLLKSKIQKMDRQHEPIKIEFAPGIYNNVHYENSFLLTELKYYPLAQLSVIAVFALTAYLAFSWSRNAEQNKVWVGLAKETAHQLGTPLSSLMAWMEIFKSDEKLKAWIRMIINSKHNIFPCLCEFGKKFRGNSYVDLIKNS